MNSQKTNTMKEMEWLRLRKIILRVINQPHHLVCTFLWYSGHRRNSRVEIYESFRRNPDIIAKRFSTSIDPSPWPREWTDKWRYSWWQCHVQNELLSFYTLYIQGVMTSLKSFLLGINFTRGILAHFILFIKL